MPPTTRCSAVGLVVVGLELGVRFRRPERREGERVVAAVAQDPDPVIARHQVQVGHLGAGAVARDVPLLQDRAVVLLELEHVDAAARGPHLPQLPLAGDGQPEGVDVVLDEAAAHDGAGHERRGGQRSVVGLGLVVGRGRGRGIDAQPIEVRQARVTGDVDEVVAGRQQQVAQRRRRRRPRRRTAAERVTRRDPWGRSRCRPCGRGRRAR